ncbi:MULTISPECIES: bifunctional (p)ppGpp synthetase/guanosine-3',5'-bis(diphosphate) 3'-pyrophosphohydrolase [unclassified Lentimicrobium]|uniref:RelA/SpoT family protein n=1 Tax=unclassified Lentimicrobium TaxID=2677434 RepID=UPI001551FABE|nr:MULTISPECIES: RelA/SpoT family protein [unclassified Lentimicrobium]NPD46667.1 bifunctional (p)ppGpp synthetase/guanosine-3',5'-bis(diphosphate) 3'-pyrophosphohydrolase [Lentimicrobium sp. S6]NPD85492.1 bifunctional (p)ppGpp synthetase/guanosine-3',5'-bis(diphosphate) 3'-pyrophosphohydrolase [Lentimicrobium sp. L6]
MYIIDEELEKQEILRLYRRILRMRLTKKDDKSDAKIIRKAFNVANEAHKGMRRRSGEPYILHPLNVALICVEQLGLGTKSIVSALLHDVVEDTDYTIEDIKALFGDKVAMIVSGLTKIKGMLRKSNVESEQAENFKRLILTLSEDVRVILVKMADRLHNMRTLDSMPHEKQLKIASETNYLFAPLAHRLGLYALKTELEDLSFKYTDPQAYDMIVENMKETEDERKRFIKTFLTPIKIELNKAKYDYKILDREKSSFSIWKKMQTKKVPFSEIYDIFAIRIIINSKPENEKKDCLMVYSIITDYYFPNEDRFRDWISTPKENGYESLHTTVMSKTGKWVEVQIRTTRMDEIAEKGYAAHWKYKSDVNKVESGLDEWMAKVREMLVKNDIDAMDFMSEFKLNLFAKEIMVFTPRGDMKKLPQDSTPIDFAYAIHTDLGNTCMAAEVNGKITALNHNLKPGDIVKIISSDNHSPQEAWLDWVITSKAKNQIKNSLKELKKANRKQGEEIIEGLFKNQNAEYNKEALQKLMKCLGCQSKLNFFHNVVTGKVAEAEIKQCLQKNEKSLWQRVLPSFLTNRTTGPQTLEESITEAIQKNPEKLMLDKNAKGKDLKYIIADCCNPIPGDDVIGININKKPIAIHRTNCPEAIGLMSTYGKQIIKAKWNFGERVGFLAGIHITGSDSQGLVSNITNVISDNYGINMRSIHFTTSANYADGTITLYINDTKSLIKLMRNIKELRGVEKVERIDSIQEFH